MFPLLLPRSFCCLPSRIPCAQRAFVQGSVIHSSWACFHLRVTFECKSRHVLDSFPHYFAGGCLKSPFFFLLGVHTPLLLSDDFNPALPRQSSVVIWELPCASRDKSHQEFLAPERCRWGLADIHLAVIHRAQPWPCSVSPS